MISLRTALEEAQHKQVAIGHFNIADFTMLEAVYLAARDLQVPVIVGVSEGERAFLGTKQVAAMVHGLRSDSDSPIYLNADHTHSLDMAVEAANAGFDSIVFDRSELPFEDNVLQTREAIKVLKRINPSLLIEGEIGNIGTGSEIHDLAPDLASGLTSPEDAKRYVEKTGVDLLAPAVGNMHGMLPSMVQGLANKHLQISRIEQIKRYTGSFLTLHGGSGTSDDDFRKAIAAGINIIHINTELRVAWRKGMNDALAKAPKEIAPYKILPAVIGSVKQVAESRLKLFNNVV